MIYYACGQIEINECVGARKREKARGRVRDGERDRAEREERDRGRERGRERGGEGDREREGWGRRASLPAISSGRGDQFFSDDNKTEIQRTPQLERPGKEHGAESAT